VNGTNVTNQSPTPSSWRTLSTRSVLDVPPWLSVLCDEIELPSGRVIDDYYRIVTPDYSLICAVRSDGKIILEHHYKPCVQRAILTSPAGGVEPGETPLMAAQRELLEETGYRATTWRSLGAFTVDGTRGICRANLFLAKGLENIAPPINDEMEVCELVFLDRQGIEENIHNGMITLLPDIALLSMVLGPFC
jgi:ADP-ribose pyrophosphatase